MSKHLQVELEISEKMKNGKDNIPIYVSDYYYKSQTDKDNDKQSHYRECVSERVVVGHGDDTVAPIDCSTTAPTCSVKTTSSGTSGGFSCGVCDSEWALYFYLNGDFITGQGDIGYIHFKQPCGGEWYVGSVETQNVTYLVTCKMEKDVGENNSARVTIQKSANQ